MIDMPILKTDRLILREIQQTDVARIRKYYPDYDFFQLARPRQIMTSKYAEFLMKKLVCEQNKITWVIDNGHGFIGSVDARLKGKKVTLQYGIGKPFRNCGFATEALMAVINHFQQIKGIEKIVAFVLENNWPSRRVLQKIGFQEHDLPRKTLKFDGTIDSIKTYELNIGPPKDSEDYL